eukprot:gene17949-19744_t
MKSQAGEPVLAINGKKPLYPADGQMEGISGPRNEFGISARVVLEDVRRLLIMSASIYMSFINDVYVLLYPDYKEVITVPGNDELPFKLNVYKEELGRPYSQLNFYLCPLAVFEPASAEVTEVTTIVDSDSDHAEGGNAHSKDCDSFTEEIFNFPPAFETLFSSDPCHSTETLSKEDDPPPQFEGAMSVMFSSSNVEDKPKKEDEIHLTYSEKMGTLSSAFSRESEDRETVVLAVRRRRVWQDASQKLARLFRDGVKPIRVQFIGEAGVDAGGPLKEFFTILFEDAKRFLFCTGNGVTYTFLHDTERLQNGEFRLFGTLVAIALIHGCAGPRYFMPALISRILKCPFVKPTIADIPDFEIQSKLNQIKVAATEEEFNEKIDSFPERFSAGVMNPSIRHKDKYDFIDKVAYHYCILACASQIEDFIQGLDVLGLLSILQNHYEESRLEFSTPDSLKASDFLSVFATINYTCDADKNEMREKEEDVYFNLTGFLEGLQYDSQEKRQTIELEDEAEIHVERCVSLADVLKFCSGSKYITKDMVGKGSISFIHPKPEQYGMGIMANTCSLVLTLPVSPRYSATPEAFHDSFVEDICSAPDFGMI